MLLPSALSNQFVLDLTTPYAVFCKLFSGLPSFYPRDIYSTSAV